MDLQKSKFNLINDPVSPRRQRAINFLQNLGRRIGRTFQNDLIYNSEEDLRTSSTNTNSFSLNHCYNNTNTEKYLNKKIAHSSSCDISSNSEITFISGNSKLLPYKKTLQSGISVPLSVSRVLQNLSQFSSFSSSTNRSNSCTNTPLKQHKLKQQNSDMKNRCDSNKIKQKEPQRILRKPVNYVYLKGMSGLPTKRVPRSALCCNYLPR